MDGGSVLGPWLCELFEPLLSLRASTLGKLTSVPRGLTLLGPIPPPRALQPLGVFLGDPSRPLQRVGELRQARRDLPCALLRVLPHELSRARGTVVGAGIDQISPSALKRRAEALILGHLLLKRGPLRVALTLPTPCGAFMVIRGCFVTLSSIVMVCRLIAHHATQYEPLLGVARAG